MSDDSSNACGVHDIHRSPRWRGGPHWDHGHAHTAAGSAAGCARAYSDAQWASLSCLSKSRTRAWSEPCDSDSLMYTTCTARTVSHVHTGVSTALPGTCRTCHGLAGSCHTRLVHLGGTTVSGLARTTAQRRTPGGTGESEAGCVREQVLPHLEARKRVAWRVRLLKQRHARFRVLQRLPPHLTAPDIGFVSAVREYRHILAHARTRSPFS